MREYEMFIDKSYYHMYCVRDKSNKDFDSSWHLIDKKDAEELLRLLNKAK